MGAVKELRFSKNKTMHFYHHQLSNGLEVVAETLPHAQSVSFAFFVRCGSRNETPGLAGVSHFLEHMVFKGTQRRRAEDVNRELDAIGANFNACTTEESTVYYASLLPEHLETAVGIFADILRPSCREADFESEKRVILEEIQMYEDSPPFGVDELIREDFFGGHPLGHSVLGTAETITSLRADAMRAYMKARYAPDKIVLAACGKVDFEALVRIAEKHCGHWEAVHTEEAVTPEFTSPRLGVKRIVKPLATQAYVLQMALAPPRTSDLRYAARVLNSIVGDDSGSRLYWALVDDGRAEHALLSYAEYPEAGLFTTGMGCEPEDLEENLEILKELYAEIRRDGVTEDEVLLAKNRIATSLVLGSEKPWGRLFGVGSEWVDCRVHRTVREELELLRAVTLEDIHAVLERYPLTESLTYAVVNA